MDLADALSRVPIVFPSRWVEIAGNAVARNLFAEWPVTNERVVSLDAPLATHRVIDRRDWRNQLHGGERVVQRGPLALNETSSPAAGDAS